MGSNSGDRRQSGECGGFGEEDGELVLQGTESQVGKDETVLEMDGGGDCTTV